MTDTIARASSTEAVEKIRAFHRAGWSYQQLEVLLGIPRRTLNNWTRQTPRTISQERFDRIIGEEITAPPLPSRPSEYSRRNPTPAAEGHGGWVDSGPVLDLVDGYLDFGWTHHALAAHLGVSRGTLESWIQRRSGRMHSTLVARVLASGDPVDPPEGSGRTRSTRSRADILEDLEFFYDTGERNIERISERLGLTVGYLHKITATYQDLAIVDGGLVRA